MSQKEIAVFRHPSTLASMNKEEYFQAIIKQSCKCADNGLVVNEDGTIIGHNDPMYAAFIQGAILIDDKTVIPATIGKTISNGLRYMIPSTDGKSTLDLGPVDNTCYIGDSEGPCAIIVPVDNYEAIVVAINELNAIKAKHEENIDDEAKVMIDATSIGDDSHPRCNNIPWW